MYSLSPEIFADRRDEFMERIGSGGVAILVANPESLRSNDTDYPYRPSSDIMYFSGFREPQTVAVFAPGHEDAEFVLFVRERDPDKERWSGRRAGVEGAKSDYDADAAFSIDQLDDTLPDFLKDRQTLYYTLGQNRSFDNRVTGWIKQLRHRRGKPPAAPGSLVDVRDITHEMRLRKRPEEVNLIRRAVDVTTNAHVRAMKHCRPEMMEYELQALLEYEFRSQGAEFPAYSTIVGAGDNATILHYIDNRDTIDDGDVVLVDAGCELGFYAADLTRSFPASGRFTAAQRDLYQAVLDTELAVIDHVGPGVAYNELQDMSVQMLTEAMIDLDLLSGSTDDLIDQNAYKQYYPHTIGHWMGIDVHDVGSYRDPDGAWRALQPGMVLTVEPGLYVPEDDQDAPAALRGVGVRIEDNILVTEDGRENLSCDCPKKIDEIEELVGTKYAGQPLRKRNGVS